MSSDGELILANLQQVAHERAQRHGNAALEARVLALKAYQRARFAKTYADLLAQARYERAVRFFLDDLYGPTDFSARDGQFARVVAPLVKLFPKEMVATVAKLARLHALSEALDTRMAQVLPGPHINAAAYLSAWQTTGRPADREQQIDLMLAVGQALDRYTRNAVLRHSLRLMRGSARAAGLGALQSFLETGLGAFREMRGAQEFLAITGERERRLAAELFAAELPAAKAAVLGLLP